MTRNLALCSDDELITSFAQGNSLAFEELLLRYKNGLYQYLLSIVKDEGAAGDLFQEVFLALFTHAAGFKTQGKLKAWLFLTARNKAFNYLRDNKLTSSLDEPDEEGNAFWHDIVPDDKPGQLEQLTRQENEEQLRQLVAQLPPRQQEVLYLRAYFSFQEIADLVHKPLGTVLADCHRALQKVRSLWQNQHEVEYDM